MLLFHWTGTEVVMSTFAGARKIAALRARPEIAVTIDAASTPPEALLIRGKASVTDVDGIVAEYALAQRRYPGGGAGRGERGRGRSAGHEDARIAVRPTWVGVLDFRTRLPGGTSAAEFERRGRAGAAAVVGSSSMKLRSQRPLDGPRRRAVAVPAGVQADRPLADPGAPAASQFPPQ